MYQPINDTRRRGFTLTEIAIVLGIIGLILGAVWMAASGVTSASETRQATTEVTQILNNYRKLYTMRGVDMTTASTDVTCLGITGGFFPAGMVPSSLTSCTASKNGTTSFASVGGDLKTPWGGKTLIRVQTNYDPQEIIISFRNLNQTQCNNFADAIMASPEILAIGALAPPFTLQQMATTICPASSNDVYVAFKAR